MLEKEPLLNGVASGAQQMSCKIRDSHLGSMEAGTSLTRALIAAVELCFWTMVSPCSMETRTNLTRALIGAADIDLLGHASAGAEGVKEFSAVIFTRQCLVVEVLEPRFRGVLYSQIHSFRPWCHGAEVTLRCRGVLYCQIYSIMPRCLGRGANECSVVRFSQSCQGAKELKCRDHPEVLMSALRSNSLSHALVPWS
ncbi:hypothetical protein NE237_030776 [Protea cynaroides]|uniref:Uncharacterized protein n=1 Tax=Protea cynaroides TaxID=273540 RepID=A0A9Q0JV63_9MAGN|nr:hypothetical protein NE237_030776 [Protea cynaroides]